VNAILPETFPPGFRLDEKKRSFGAGKANEEIMESAAELHEARVLRARIEVQEAELAELKADYRRILARQADRDYRRRRAEWRAQQGAVRGRRDSACA